MAKAQTKKLTKSKAAPKAKAIQLTKRASNTAAQSGVWTAELSELQSRTFSSLDEALDTLIDRVVTRLGKAGKAEREFVKLLFETDPGLMSSLKKAVRVK